MALTACHMSISLDGFVAGPDQGRDDPVGVGGLKLHEWHQHSGEPGHEADAGPRDELMKRCGAYVMGRNMLFDGVGDPGLHPVEVIHSPRATHVRYRVGR